MYTYFYGKKKKIHLFTYYLETFKDHLLRALYMHAKSTKNNTELFYVAYELTIFRIIVNNQEKKFNTKILTL